MEILNKIIKQIPEIEDQQKLFEETLKGNKLLSKEHIKMIAWASSMVTRDEKIVSLIKSKVGELDEEEKRILHIASSRMSVTNPYFMGRSVSAIDTGGTIEDIGLRPFPSLGIVDELAYHYICMVFSLINGGYMCYGSHKASLLRLGQHPGAIDQALKLAVVISAIRQNIFNSAFL
ncbi:hypothetical protein [Flagellimonas onchidii]|uniref:hypothetical protein n=1 Tax=Flagellimonas onchidii TaxID=2562684 RepID=UPI0010A65797|nr:hypothetical protein [Allomuricauda onchidii]